MCLTIPELFCYMIITCFDLVTSCLGVDPLCFVLFVVWALNAIRWRSSRFERSFNLVVRVKRLGVRPYPSEAQLRWSCGFEEDVSRGDIVFSLGWECALFVRG